MKPYSKMIASDFTRSIDQTEDGIRNCLKTSRVIRIYGFKSELASLDFARMFPKYVKIKPIIASSRKTDINEFEKWEIDSVIVNGEYTTYGIEFKVDKISEVTGDSNELGDKRINKFIEVLKNHGYID